MRWNGTTWLFALLMTTQFTVNASGGRKEIVALPLFTVVVNVTGILLSSRVTVWLATTGWALFWQTLTWSGFGSLGQLSVASGTPSPSVSTRVSLTVILTVFVSESCPSLTVNSTRYGFGPPWADDGVHAKTALVPSAPGVRLAPAGRPPTANFSGNGPSTSVAVTVNVSGVPSLMVNGPGTVRTGGALTGGAGIGMGGGLLSSVPVLTLKRELVRPQKYRAGG